MEQSSFLNFLESEKLSEEKLKIAKGQLNTLRYQSFAMRFLNEQDTDESSDVPKNVLMRKLSCSSKYTFFYPVLIYDEDFPEEAVSFEEIFLEAFKILDNSERTQHILDYLEYGK